MYDIKIKYSSIEPSSFSIQSLKICTKSGHQKQILIICGKRYPSHSISSLALIIFELLKLLIDLLNSLSVNCLELSRWKYSGQ